jgi:hypothetical protein
MTGRVAYPKIIPDFTVGDYFYYFLFVSESILANIYQPQPSSADYFLYTG